MPARRTGLAAARRIVAGAFLFAGLFVLCFGLGNGRQGVMIAGAAITVLAFGARVATNLRRSPRRWIQGTGHIVAVSEPPPTDARFGRTAIELVVDAPGLPRETVTIHDSRVPVGQWPVPGQELPIQIAADDVRNLRVSWRSAAAASAAAGAGWVEDEEPGWEESGPDQPLTGAGPPPAGAGPPPPPEDGDDIDFDLDGPPTVPLGPLPAELDRPAEPSGPAGPAAPAVPVRRLPRPRPRRRPEPVPAGAVARAPAGDPVDDLVTTYPSAHPGPAGAINGVGVTVLVADLERSVEFYRDRLGFYEVDGGEGSAVLASGETRLVLRQAPDLGTVNRRLVHLNLEVSDIDAMYAELKGNGVRFLYPPRAVSRSARLELWAAAFRDPDGHGIALTQWRSV